MYITVLTGQYVVEWNQWLIQIQFGPFWTPFTWYISLTCLSCKVFSKGLSTKEWKVQKWHKGQAALSTMSYKNKWTDVTKLQRRLPRFHNKRCIKKTIAFSLKKPSVFYREQGAHYWCLCSLQMMWIRNDASMTSHLLHYPRGYRTCT